MNGPKPVVAGDNAVIAPSPIEKETDAPITAAVATETALSVVAQWEEEKVIQPVGQDYVEELRGPDGKMIESKYIAKIYLVLPKYLF